MAQRFALVLDPARPRGAARLGWAAGSLAAAIALNGALAAAEPIVEAPFGRQAGAGEAAAAKLARLDSPQARTIARAMRLRDWNARRVQGSTLFDEPAAARPLLAALRDDQPAVRRIALWGLSEMRPAPAGAAAPVARLLADPAAEVRGEAARALGDLGSVAHAEDVAALLRDPHAAVRRQAAHALGDLQDPAIAPALEAALNDPDPSVRDKAAWALRQVREAETILRRYRSG
jgi:HEAT repeat protein